jgi:hypothetical protein
VILSLLILLLSFQKMNVDIEELKKANDQLKLLNESYNTAEMTAGLDIGWSMLKLAIIHFLTIFPVDGCGAKCF